MSDETPPPSSSPPTTREPSNATGGLDPYPPNPGARSLKLAPHAVLVIELAAVAVLARGSWLLAALPALLVLAAWSAWLLSRIDARHRPIAIGIGAWAVLQLLAATLNATVCAAPGPYLGLARAAYHVEQATRLATAALPAWMALATLTLFPPGPSTRKHLAWWLPWAGAIVLLVVGYPELRGDALRRVYLGAELAALFVAVVAILSWVLHRAWGPGRVRFKEGGPRAWLLPRWYTWGTVLSIVGGALALLGVGAWRYGLFGDAYLVQQGGLLAVWGLVVLLQGAALVVARRRV